MEAEEAAEQPAAAAEATAEAVGPAEKAQDADPSAQNAEDVAEAPAPASEPAQTDAGDGEAQVAVEAGVEQDSTDGPAPVAPVEEPASAGPERPPSAAAERPASAAAERPASAMAERPASAAAQRPPSAAAERPASGAAERPVSAAAERPASAAAERPASAAAVHPASAAAERPASAAAERPASAAAERPASAAAERPASAAAERPASAAAERPGSAQNAASPEPEASPPRPGSDFARTPTPEGTPGHILAPEPATPEPTAGEARPASRPPSQQAEAPPPERPPSEGRAAQAAPEPQPAPTAEPAPEQPVTWKVAKPDVPVPAAVEGHPPGRNVSVLVHNVLANCWVTPEWYEGVDAALLDPARRRHIVMDRIAAYDADIVCLQEVERGELQYLLERFRTEERPLYFATSLAYNSPTAAGVDNGCVVLLRSRFFEPDFDVENQVWNEEGSAGNIVLCTRKVAGRLAFVRVCLVNCHLAVGKHGLKQAQRIVHRVRHFLRAKPADIVLWVGDFNADLASETMREVLEDGFRDAAAGPDPAAPEAREPTYAPANPSAGGGPSRVDFILFKGDVAGVSFHVPQYSGGGGQQGRAEWSLREFGSDHSPLACRFSFEDKPWQP
eukprot:tig00001187_g7456.t1